MSGERAVPGYQWRKAMSYLFVTGATPVGADPVCGMPVEPGGPHSIVTGGTTICFCSRRCLLIYEASASRASDGPPDEGR